MSALPRLFIDSLELTIPVEEHFQQLVQQRLEYASGRFNLTEHEARGRYRSRYKLIAESGHKITIKSRPTSRTANFLKLEYSPAKAAPEGAALLAAYLQFVLGSNYREAFYQGRVNRLDASFDVRRVPIDHYWIEDKRADMDTAFIFGDGQQLETIYLGYKASRQLCIYDKAAEIESRNGTVSASVPWVRFEYRCNRADYPLGELYRRMKNPYHNFVVRRYAPLPHLMPNLQAKLLFDACILRGKQGVLNSIPEEEREATEGAIKAFPYATIWKRRSAIWVQLRDRVEELLPVESAPTA
jgi:Replication initiation factor